MKEKRRGRPKKDPRLTKSRQITVRAPAALIERAETIAKEKGVTRAEIVQEALEQVCLGYHRPAFVNEHSYAFAILLGLYLDRLSRRLRSPWYRNRYVFDQAVNGLIVLLQRLEPKEPSTPPKGMTPSLPGEFATHYSANNPEQKQIGSYMAEMLYNQMFRISRKTNKHSLEPKCGYLSATSKDPALERIGSILLARDAVPNLSGTGK